MDAIALLRSQFEQAHGILEGTLGDISGEQAHWCDASGVMPAAAHYAHVVVGEDALLSQFLAGSQPLMMGAWQGKTGISEPPPLGDWSMWSRAVQVDLDATRAYAQAVHAQTDAYLASLSPTELAREVEGPLGKMTVGGMLSILVANTYMHTGETATIKGLQGLRGYPF